MRVTLDELAGLHQSGGMAAVLQTLADEARGLASRSLDVYDNRLVLQMAAELDRIARDEY